MQKSGLFGGGFVRKVDYTAPEGCVQFEKGQRRAKTIGCLRGGIVWDYRLRLKGQTWVQIPAPSHTSHVTLGSFHSLPEPLLPYV